MPAIELTPAQRKEHRAAAHHLSPVVMVGGDGLTAAVVKEIDLALKAHGLIKVRVFSDDRPAREAMFAQLSDELGAAPIQHIGKLLVLWRPMPAKDKTEREDRMAGPRTAFGDCIGLGVTLFEASDAPAKTIIALLGIDSVPAVSEYGCVPY